MMERRHFGQLLQGHDLREDSTRHVRMHELRQRGNSRGRKHPDPPEYIAAYRTQEKASRGKNCGRLRLRTGVGLYRSSMKKWGLADSAACECSRAFLIL